MTMEKTKVPRELKYLAPFFHDIELGKGYNTAPESYRMREAINLFFPSLLKLHGGSLKGLRILDVGCNSGGFSFAATKYGAKEVVGIDPDPHNIKQAEAISAYLKNKKVKFLKFRAEELDGQNLGKFDIVILAGILYHLTDPIGTMQKIAKLAKSTLLIDSHVHYTTDSTEEDIPSWWMLSDTDRHDLEGLFVNDKTLSLKEYLKFERENPVDYNSLPKQFIPSPHTQRDIKFIRKYMPHGSGGVRTDCNIGSAKSGNLVLIPNKKALFKMVRYFGFEDLMEVIPHRFSSLPYKENYRVCLFALRRSEKGPFPISETQRALNNS